MMPEYSTRSIAGNNDLLTLAQQARNLSSQLEQGQSTLPCTDALTRLIEDYPDRPPQIAIACTSDHLKVEVVNHLIAAGWTKTEDCKFGLRGRGGGGEVRIAFVNDLRHTVAAWQEFVEDGQILLVVDRAENTVDTLSMASLNELVASFPVVIPWIIAEGETLSTGWWNGLKPGANSVIAPPQFVPLVGSVVAFANVENAEMMPIFATIQDQRRGRWLQLALNALLARAQREATRMREAQAKLDGVPKLISGKSANAEKEWAKQKEAVAIALTRIDKELTLKSERATQPLGKWTGLIREIASSLLVDDLEKTQTASILKLSVNASHLAKINRRIEHALRQELTEDLTFVNRQVEKAIEELTGGNRRTREVGIDALPMLKDQSIWPAVENLMAVGKVTEIDLVRRGFFDVLTAGRQKVFIVIMFVSLMGRMGLPNLFQSGGSKVAFGIFMAAVMIGSMINSILLWRREKEVQSERELAKIRDSLFQDACKVIEQVEKVKLGVVREYLKEVGGRMESHAKLKCEEESLTLRSHLENEQRMREQAKRGFETRVKLLAEMERQLGKLTETTQSIWQATCGSLMRLTKQITARSSLAAMAEGESILPPSVAEAGTSDAEKATSDNGAGPRTTPRMRVERPIGRTETRTSGLLERRRLRAEAS